MFFVMLSGWGMYKLLTNHFLKETPIAFILSCCYMLSGFTVGSTQWFFDITAVAFIPILLNCLLNLLKAPNFKNSMFFSVAYYIMFTTGYPALSIITTYGIITFLLLFLGNKLINDFSTHKKYLSQLVMQLGLAGFMTIILCIPCLYYSLEVLKNIERGNPILENQLFFYSNYLHPKGLLSMLLPFSSAKVTFFNTEGTMTDTYMGLFVLLLLPIAIQNNIAKKRLPFLLLIGAILFLIISFGPLGGLRNMLNVLPGMSYFRNAAIFRYYFILLVIIYLATCLKDTTLVQILNRKAFVWMAILLMSIFLILFMVNCNSLLTFSFKSLTVSLKAISYKQTIALNALLQISILSIIILLVKAKKTFWIPFLFVTEIILNALLCMPYHAASSYSLKEVTGILHSAPGFPIQTKKVSAVPSQYTDYKGNTWHNINIFSKQVSSNSSYVGPLVLKNVFADSALTTSFNNPIVYLENIKANDSIQLAILSQRPNSIKLNIDFTDTATIVVLQNYFPGWQCYYNGISMPFLQHENTWMKVVVPPGKAVVEFRFEKNGVVISALIIHLLIISIFIYALYKKIKYSFFSYISRTEQHD